MPSKIVQSAQSLLKYFTRIPKYLAAIGLGSLILHDGDTVLLSDGNILEVTQ